MKEQKQKYRRGKSTPGRPWPQRRTAKVAVAFCQDDVLCCRPRAARSTPLKKVAKNALGADEGGHMIYMGSTGSSVLPQFG